MSRSIYSFALRCKNCLAQVAIQCMQPLVVSKPMQNKRLRPDGQRPLPVELSVARSLLNDSATHLAFRY
jgi:hypothetical protein